MAITYDNVNKIIYIPDGVEGIEMLPDDILAADVLGGWNVFINPYPNYYECIARIYLNGGWLKVYQNCIAWPYHANLDVAGFRRRLMFAYSSGGLVMGARVAGTNRVYRGGTLLYYSGLNNGYVEFSGATAKIYAATIKHVSGSGGYSPLQFYLVGGNNHVEVIGSMIPYTELAANGCDASSFMRNTIITDEKGPKAMVLNSSAMTYDNVTFLSAQFGGYNHAAGTVLRNCRFYASEGLYCFFHGISYAIDCIFECGKEFRLAYADTIFHKMHAWQPTFFLGSLSGPVIEDLDVKAVDGKGAIVYRSAGYGGSDAKTNASGQLDFSTIGGGALYNPNDTTIAELMNESVTGTSEVVDDSFKDHLIYAKKDGLIELSGAKLIMDRARLNCPVYVLPKSAMSYPAGMTIGETGRVNVVKEPQSVKVVI